MNTKMKDIDNLNFTNIQLLKNLTIDSYVSILLDNTYIVFKSIRDILYLIFSDKNKSIISINLINNKIINEIKNAHEKEISNFRYYLDNNNKRDLILSISADNNNIKLWNINNYECLLNMNNINKYGWIFSACFLNYKDKIYITTSHFCHNVDNIELIKNYDLNGNKIKEINDSNNNTYFIDIYYDIKLTKNFIIAGNYGCVNSYDYEENKLYKEYYDNNNNYAHYSIVIFNKEEIVELIESCYDGIIRIWDFISGELLNKITVNNIGLFSICLYNDEYLFAGCMNGEIKLIDLNKRKVIKEIKIHNNIVLTIKKMIHPKYGECLISQGYGDDGIKLWVN